MNFLENFNSVLENKKHLSSGFYRPYPLEKVPAKKISFLGQGAIGKVDLYRMEDGFYAFKSIPDTSYSLEQKLSQLSLTEEWKNHIKKHERSQGEVSHIQKTPEILIKKKRFSKNLKVFLAGEAYKGDLEVLSKNWRKNSPYKISHAIKGALEGVLNLKKIGLLYTDFKIQNILLDDKDEAIICDLEGMIDLKELQYFEKEILKGEESDEKNLKKRKLSYQFSFTSSCSCIDSVEKLQQSLDADGNKTSIIKSWEESLVYSAGTCFYNALCGENPFNLIEQERGIYAPKIEPIVENTQEYQKLSQKNTLAFRSLISSMLSKNPEQRPSIEECIKKLTDIDASHS